MRFARSVPQKSVVGIVESTFFSCPRDAVIQVDAKHAMCGDTLEVAYTPFAHTRPTALVYAEFADDAAVSL